MEDELEIVDPMSKKRPFAPHMTVAFRDLTKKNFKLAWQQFKTQELYFQFTATELTLLRHNKKRWQIHSQFPLIDKEHDINLTDS